MPFLEYKFVTFNNVHDEFKKKIIITGIIITDGSYSRAFVAGLRVCN